MSGFEILDLKFSMTPRSLIILLVCSDENAIAALLLASVRACILCVYEAHFRQLIFRRPISIQDHGADRRHQKADFDWA